MMYAAEWHRCRHWIEAALERDVGAFTIEDVEAELAEGRCQFWPGAKAAAITRLITLPRAKWLSIWLAGGDLEELLAMVPTWRSFAEHHGCANLSLTGREGWKRVLGKHGWKARAVSLVLPLAERKG